MDKQSFPAAATVLLVGVGVAVFSTPPALAWTAVAPGIEYQEFHLPDPNNVFVARMDRHNPQCILDSSIAQGRLSGGTETVSSQAARYDDALNYWERDWGMRNDVAVAVNGDFWTDGIPHQGQVQSGWLAKEPGAFEPHFVYSFYRLPFLGRGVLSNTRIMNLDTGFSTGYDAINAVRGTDQIVVYTPQWDTTTLTDNTGVEVVVEMGRPALLTPPGSPAVGRVREVRVNQGSTPIPFDHVVLSASGSKAATLADNFQVGDTVGISHEVTGTKDWTDVYTGIGGMALMENFFGTYPPPTTTINRHPRTAIGFNDDYIFFVVVDGRSSVSIGMNLEELPYFMRNTLGAHTAINLDGGGSSTMVVNGQVMNNPSDGRERAVASGVMMIVLQPKQQTATFHVGDQVRITSRTDVRLGPGTHYPSLLSANPNTLATVLDHSLRGIYAKGQYWWKCDVNGVVGWVSGNALALDSPGNFPVFTAHPAATQVCPGGIASFSVAASGTGTLSYRWQLDGADLTDDGHFSGTNTPVLTIGNVGPADQGAYRCIVTDDVGSVTSHTAPLTLFPATVVDTQPQSQTIYPATAPVNATFTITASGYGTLSYQWQKGTTDLVDDGHYAGTTSPTLTILNADSRDAGRYRCRVSADCGTTYSEYAVLTVANGDVDADGDVDLEDWGLVQNCLGGVDVGQTNPDCVPADLNGDDRVDTKDASLFKKCATGATIPPPPGC